MTAPTSVVPVQPDLEKLAWSALQPLSGVTSWTYALVTDFPPWQLRYGLQVDARASTKRSARDKAERARQIVLGLPDAAWPDGVITYVQPTDGPSWLPDDDGCPRYTARYEVRCHPSALVPAPGLT